MDNRIYLIEMGKRIRALRRERGISMRKLEKLCKLNKCSISFIENGKFDSKIITLKLLADTIGVDVKDFL